jgi:hypothetical protein
LEDALILRYIDAAQANRNLNVSKSQHLHRAKLALAYTTLFAIVIVTIYYLGDAKTLDKVYKVELTNHNTIMPTENPTPAQPTSQSPAPSSPKPAPPAPPQNVVIKENGGKPTTLIPPPPNPIKR